MGHQPHGSLPHHAALLAGATLLAAVACGTSGEPVSVEVPAPDVSSAAPATGAAAPVDPASVRADELGMVPVLMYHQITDQPSSVYDRTPGDFRDELERLVREDYVPVRTVDYATGRMDVPAGKHPVVLTFDDSTVSQLAFDERGEPAANTAVGILLDVARAHPEFRPVASFYVNSAPFNDPGGERTLKWLHEHGFEIGNHTATHANLSSSGSDQVQREITDVQREIQRAVPGVEVVTIALPFGAMPEPDDLAVRGSSGDSRYEHRAVLLVGSNPAPSPFAKDFDPARVPRIRSQGRDGEEAAFGSTAWLDKLASGEVPRYTSDGDPDHVSFPKNTRASVAPEHEGKARPY
ncbi:polysaccharide deacetylase family protein [Streptoalloteichus hindustanus]|uniref:Polysaccharide deacetylase n=1 Tax=Streptoalloteichus hindustanus TaxID=2017 RepID=A0A1M5GXD0_STRHI|nr:polysaccharide deacetylase family protein [Streptoalloteichus hindustanus]SHG08373.1 Polysaccharide deacetylase [Streptoalloteichus hindustanus]